jgi:prepilin-type N-terminal cleavage/methylation domain-containing protein
MRIIHEGLPAGRQGFTLIESVVVIAIISTLALISMNTITEFQKNSILTSAAQELTSTLRLAQQNSIAGKLQPDEDTSSFGSNGIPNYDVHISGNTYLLVRMFNNGTLVSEPPIASTSADPTLTITTNPPNVSDIMFYRFTGTTSATVKVNLIRTNGTMRSTTVNTNGFINN